MRLVERRGLQKIPEFTGSPEQYDGWKFRMRGFLQTETELLKMLDWVEARAMYMGRDAISTISEATPTGILNPNMESEGPVTAEWHEANSPVKAHQRIQQWGEELYACLRQNLMALPSRRCYATSRISVRPEGTKLGSVWSGTAVAPTGPDCSGLQSVSFVLADSR